MYLEGGGIDPGYWERVVKHADVRVFVHVVFCEWFLTCREAVVERALARRRGARGSGTGRRAQAHTPGGGEDERLVKLAVQDLRGRYLGVGQDVSPSPSPSARRATPPPRRSPALSRGSPLSREQADLVPGDAAASSGEWTPTEGRLPGYLAAGDEGGAVVHPGRVYGGGGGGAEGTEEGAGGGGSPARVARGGSASAPRDSVHLPFPSEGSLEGREVATEGALGRQGAPRTVSFRSLNARTQLDFGNSSDDSSGRDEEARSVVGAGATTGSGGAGGGNAAKLAARRTASVRRWGIGFRGVKMAERLRHLRDDLFSRKYKESLERELHQGDYEGMAHMASGGSRVTDASKGHTKTTEEKRAAYRAFGPRELPVPMARATLVGLK